MVTDQRLTLHTTLIVVLAGEADIERGELVTRMSRGSACFCAGESTFGITPCTTQGAVSVAVLYFSLFQADNLYGHAFLEAAMEGILPQGIVSMTGSEDRIASLCRSIYENSRHPDGLKTWRAQIDFQEMLYSILTTWNRGVGNSKTQALEQSKKYMEEHYGEDLSVDQLAGIAELSPKYYAELFKKTYGSSAMDYLTEIRMNKAKQLMLGSDRLLREVAHRVGYRDEFYFSRKFKKVFGMSPSAYLKTQKNKLAVYGSSSVLGFLIPLQITPYAAPLHPKWSREYHHALASVVPVHLSAFRQNHNKHENLRKLAASEPELIICASGIEAWERERLQEIAPVYQMKEETLGWKNQLMELAELLDKPTEAKSWLMGFERKVHSAVQNIPELLNEKTGSPRILPLRLYSDKLHINEGRGVEEVLFTILGLTPVSLMKNTPSGVSLKITQLADCEADHILLLVRQDTETLEYWRELQASPEWLRIRALRAGNIHVLPSYPWREYSPIAISRMLEEIPSFFSGNNP